MIPANTSCPPQASLPAISSVEAVVRLLPTDLLHPSHRRQGPRRQDLCPQADGLCGWHVDTDWQCAQPRAEGPAVTPLLQKRKLGSERPLTHRSTHS